MAVQIIGRVTSGRTKKSIEVKWDSHSGEIYVGYAGWTYIGKAYNAKDVMIKAEAWLYNK